MRDEEALADLRKNGKYIDFPACGRLETPSKRQPQDTDGRFAAAGRCATREKNLRRIVFNESPLGLAAFILDKFAAWTNPNWKQLNKGGLERFNMTSLLDNIMIYWVTRSISTSMRITYETLNDMDYFLSSYVIEVPSACARFSHDLVYPLKFILNNKFKNLLKLTDYKGGHFATLETPTFVASDIFHFVHKVLYPNQPTIKPVVTLLSVKAGKHSPIPAADSDGLISHPRLQQKLGSGDGRKFILSQNLSYNVTRL
ncbi:hypothetical protein NQ318_017914 [Aromia moschata]|uniref:Uncharacterized protein n=1 Tax=Aromia moschata TaxID=1265417 RepID=A0AAV8YCL1_9CUCU|nr:hypothetical protein NQ318_017914 [Aromia moschata]